VLDQRRQAGTHREIALPEGMPLSLARELETLIAEAMDNGTMPFDRGIKCFEVIRERMGQDPRF
jgi:hypothetical protein